MAKFQKGETVWVASIRYGEIRVASHTVTLCGEQQVGLSKASSASGHSTRIPVGRAHASKRLALEQVREYARETVERLERQLDEARALVDAIGVEIDKA